MKNRNKKWTTGEQNYLIENRYESIKFLIQKLGRTKKSIQSRISKLKKEGLINESYVKRIPRKSHEIFQWDIKTNREAR